MGASVRSIPTCIILLAFAIIMPTTKCLTEGPELTSTNATTLLDTIEPESASAKEAFIPGGVKPQWPASPNSGRSDSPLLRDTLRMLAARPGEPGSEDNPGTIVPGPTQKWLAAAFHGGLIPIERLKFKNERCSKRSICEEGTCCLDYGGTRKRCKPLGKRGDHCVDWAITTVYSGICPCDPNEGTCQFGICM
ncbi:uncharacterized protein LOC142765421 isoform X2 [Rhipicephalus microplus]|uniref:uncharacterized protein LOC142765421 isoform X2 n=1 Tax=Rhipicephalus microplus TaxID=6941 RepID=UPI003F6BDA51